MYELHREVATTAHDVPPWAVPSRCKRLPVARRSWFRRLFGV